MTDTQFIVTMAVAPTLSLVIVLAGYIVQNANLNARIAEIRTDFDRRISTEMGAMREVLRAELAVIRAEMERNHSELLARFADLDRRLTRLEHEVRGKEKE
jgi:hypothetical protein